MQAEAERQESCAARIDAQYQGRVEQLQKLNRRRERHWSRDSETATEELYNLPLSIELEPVIRFCLSWGGPADYVEWNPVRDTWMYIFQDWFDGARRTFDDEGAKDAIRAMIGDDPESFIRSQIEQMEL